jgi:hypothetical protein
MQKGTHATLFIGGDFQFHSTGFKEEIFQEFKKDFLTSPNPYFIGLGDYGDFLRPSLRTWMTLSRPTLSRWARR